LEREAAVDGASGGGKPVNRGGARLRALLELFKLRMIFHILITTAVGFYLASPIEPDWVLMMWTLLGTGMLAAAAFSFNQAMEIRQDREMARTQARPLPSGRLGLTAAYTSGVVATVAGTILLWWQANLLTAVLGLATVILYTAVYTPLKRLTTLNTLVGGIPGALPPLMGWTAAQNHLGTGGVLLFALLFFWQLPHFLALAWMYRDDYRRGGFRMLSLVDDSGETCFRQIWIQSLLLIAVSLLPHLYGIAGEAYLAVALAAGGVQMWLALRLRATRTREAAVRVFLWSLIYLPLVLLAMALDKRMLFIG
jgi:heme o synthase